MELSYEEAQRMVTDRLNQYSEIWNLYSNPSFKVELLELLIFLEIDTKLLPLIENEILVVITFYETAEALSRNICTNAGIPEKKCDELVLMLNATILSPLQNELLAFQYLWNHELTNEGKVPEANKEFREKLELRPQASAIQQVRPLTREAVAQALAPSRTMAKDIQSASKSSDVKWESEK